MLKKFIFFCIVGVLSAVVDLTVFNLLFEINTPFAISRTFAVLSAIAFNFALNRNITFKAKTGLMKRQFPKHVLVYTLVLITNVVISSIAIYLLGENPLNANIASIFGIISGIPISFFGSMRWTFAPENLYISI
ncbi:MAG: GtrA family protein [Nanoarchaeota archaeon]